MNQYFKVSAYSVLPVTFAKEVIFISHHFHSSFVENYLTIHLEICLLVLNFNPFASLTTIILWYSFKLSVEIYTTPISQYSLSYLRYKSTDSKLYLKA